MSFQTDRNNFKIGVGLIPNTPSQRNTKLGDLEVFGTNLYFHNGTTNDIIARLNAAQTFTNKTLVAPTITNALITATQLDVLDGNSINLFDNDSTNFIGLKAPASVPTDYTLIFPANAPSGSVFLQHLSGGQLAWVTGSPPPTPNVVLSVTGLNTDNTDPLNPVVQISVDGVTITGDGTPGNPLTGSPSGITDLTGDVTATGPGSTAATLANIGAGVTTTLGSDATGDIYYRNSSGELDRLPIGTNGDVLAVTTGLPSWVASAVSAGNLVVDRFSGNGVQTVFTLSVAPGSVNNAQVYITGVCQNKNTYSVVGTTLTFSEAPPLGTDNIEVVIGTTLPIGTPSDGTVTTVKLADTSVTDAKINSGSALVKSRLEADGSGGASFNTPAFFVGNIDNANAWSTVSTTFTDVNNASSVTLNTIANFNFSSVVLASGNLPGVTITPPTIGRYLIQFNTIGFMSLANTEIGLRLLDGSNNVLDAGRVVTLSSVYAAGNIVCTGIYDATTTSAFTIKLQMRSSSGSSTARIQNYASLPPIHIVVTYLG